MINRLRSFVSACIALVLVIAWAWLRPTPPPLMKLGLVRHVAFELSTVNIKAGDTIKFVNNKMAPNAVFDGHDELATPTWLSPPANPGKKPSPPLAPMTSTVAPPWCWHGRQVIVE